MNAKFCLLLISGFLVAHPHLLAQEKPHDILPDDPTKAWAEVEKVFQALGAPDDWRTHAPTAEQVAEFQKQVRQTAVSFADKAREFVQRFPTMRILAMRALSSSTL